MTAHSPAESVYRADIDGLRALAVIPVILFHCEVAGWQGGFVGVDVFFVISGFLITSILQREIEISRFSIVAFYERRIRRIVPALAAVLVFTAAVMPFFLLPNDLKDFGRSVFATVTFSSNVYFFIRGDYFDTAAEFMPLLHTWSLAVEEQYYIFFPLLLALLARRSRRATLIVLAAITVLSFAFCLYQTALAPRAAFFLPFGRIWELLLGSILAVAPRTLRERMRHAAVGWTGIMLIAVAIATLNEETRFPGPAALLPCMGAVFVLGCGTGTAARWLGCGPLRGIGLISYSLYLWHWPLLAGTRYLYGPDLSATAIGVVIAATFAAAYLSWRFVEAPWRRRSSYWNRPRIFLVAATVGVALAAVGLLCARFNGANRFSEPVRTLASGSLDINPLRESCDRPSLKRVLVGDLCSIGSGDEDSFVVLGDSIGDALVPAVDAAAKQAHRRGLVMTYSGCAPLFGVAVGNEHCRNYYSTVADVINALPKVRDVIVIGRWATIVEGTRFGERRSTERFMSDDLTVEPSYQENYRVFARAMDRYATLLRGKRISIVAFVPEQPVNVPRGLAMEALRGVALSPGISRQDFEARTAHTRELIMSAVHRNAFNLVDIGKLACNAQSCPTTDAQGRPLYADDNHPSRTAALAWNAAFSSVFADRTDGP
jgi:peptidoglycan/LPS O-acetylase OafA/YrhL